MAERVDNLVYIEEKKYLWMMGRQIDRNSHLSFLLTRITPPSYSGKILNFLLLVGKKVQPTIKISVKI